MKTRQIFLLLSIISVVALISSCSKYPGFKKSENGIYYKFYVQHKDSLKTKEGDIMTLNIKYHMKINGKDSVLLNSSTLPRKFELPLQKSDFKGDIYEALGMLHKGDSATFIVNAKDFFLKTARMPSLPKGVDSLAGLYFDVKLVNAESVEALKKAEKEKLDKLKAEEPAKLENYLKSKNISVSPSDSGIYFVNHNVGTGRLIVKGDFVKINLTVSSIDDKKIFSSIDQNRPITFEYGKPFDSKGFDDAIGKMKLGSKAKVIVPSARAFGEVGRKNNQGMEIIAPFSPVIYDVEVLEVKTKAEHEKAAKEEEAKAKKAADDAKNNESGLIAKYVKDNKITVKPTASGLYYIEKVKGTGAKAVKGKKVKVHYTGRLFNGKVFDSSLDRKPSTPYEFVLGTNQVIAGWDEGIALMNVGGKATLIVPSALAYGAQGGGSVIPPFSPLVFDVELIEVEK